MSISGVGQSSYAYSSTTSGTASGASAGSQADRVKSDFLKWANMTPAQRMRANILSSMGLTEEQVAAMSPKERQKVEEKIREMIEEKLRHSDKRPGQLVDQKA